MANVLAIDIGGTTTRLQVQTDQGSIRGTAEFPTNGDDYTTWTQLLVEKMGAEFGAHYDAIGVGVAGNVQAGVLTGSGNLPGWIDLNIGRLLRHLSGGLPTVVMNDCAAAALGEYSLLQRDMIYVIWGTGVGASVVNVIDGAPRVKATELGHMVIDGSSPHLCGCGGYGHLEALVGGGNLQKRFDVPASELTDEKWRLVLREMSFGLRNLSCGDIGLPIVLGGGVAYMQRHRLNELQVYVNLLKAPCQTPELILASHGENSGLIGARYAAHQLLTKGSSTTY